MSRPVAVLCLLIATMIWGFSFVAQKYATYSMGPLTFIAARYLLGGLCVLPLALWERRRQPTQLARREWLLMIPFILVFFVGSWLQQGGLMTASATNGGFLTGLYVFFVPLILFLGFRQKPHPIVWLCAPLALGGLFLLNGGVERLHVGDLLLIGCAVFWALQILLLGYLVRLTGLPVCVSAVCFTGAGFLAAGGSLILEAPTLSGLWQGWIAIAYSGVLSTSVAFSLQAIGQRYVPSANAAIVLSAESLFAGLGGALLLNERLPAAGYLGAALIFAAILLVEAVPALSAPAAGAPNE